VMIGEKPPAIDRLQFRPGGLLMTRSLRASSNASSKAFTLIEILVVIVIIGVLATMGVSKYTEFTATSRKNSCGSNQTSINKGVGVWESQNVAITKLTKTTLTFNGGGDITATSGSVPTKLNTNAESTAGKGDNKRAISGF